MVTDEILNECCNTYCYCYANGVCRFTDKSECPRIKSYIHLKEEGKDYE